jgi:hypothetical protein
VPQADYVDFIKSTRLSEPDFLVPPVNIKEPLVQSNSYESESAVRERVVSMNIHPPLPSVHLQSAETLEEPSVMFSPVTTTEEEIEASA